MGFLNILKNMKLKYISWGIFFILLCGVVFSYWFIAKESTEINIGESYDLEVKQGMTFYNVLDELDNKFIIDGTLWFKLYNKISDDLDIQAGS